MKIIKLFTVLAFICITNATMAKIWRVNNITGVNANFTDLQSAHDSASTGDTLAVEGSAVSYGNCVVTKRIHIMGSGYFLAENAYTQAKKSPSIAGDITFNAGSTGSVITGMTVTFVGIHTSSIFIIRNYIIRYYEAAHVYGNVANVVFKQNYMQSTGTICIVVDGGCSNIIITNNYMQSINANYDAVNGNSSSNMEISQNVIYGALNVYNTVVTNNIVLNCNHFSGSNNGINNNISNSGFFGNTNGNKDSVDMATVFMGSGSTDGRWMLKPGSPAIAAGISGEDCGMYGGTEPYVLSGIPAAPTIYFLTSPTSGSGAQGLPVHVKVKSHN